MVNYTHICISNFHAIPTKLSVKVFFKTHTHKTNNKYGTATKHNHLTLQQLQKQNRGKNDWEVMKANIKIFPKIEGHKPLLSLPCCCSVAKLCLTFCNLMDGNPSGSSVHGILQTRILEWVATSLGDLPVRQAEQGKGVQNGGGYREGREKPSKMKQKKVWGPEWGPQVKQTTLLLGPIYIGQTQG